LSSLDGLRVLVVEDEALVSMLLEAMLEDLGCVVVGPAGRLAEAVKLMEADIDGIHVALLDVNVAGEQVFPVAQALKAAGKPFAFSTGYGEAGVGDGWRGGVALQKPYTFEDVRVVLEKLAAAR
jgi:CheY-like chemotaxis protein